MKKVDAESEKNGQGIGVIVGVLTFLSGIIGGLFGAGGGGLTYYVLNKTREQEKTQEIFAQTLLVTLPSAMISLLIYEISKPIETSYLIRLFVPCAVGGALGAVLAKRASGVLKIIFSLLLIASGIISIMKQFGIL